MLFDAAGTLFDLVPPIHAVIASSAARHGHQCAPDHVERALGHVGGTLGWPDDEPDSAGRMRAWTVFARRIIGEAGLHAPEATLQQIAEQAAATILEPANYQAFPDAVPLIERLAAAGIRIGIVSNFDDLLFDILDCTGLGALFETVLTSYRTGISKPDPRIFHLAARAIRAEPAATYYIGDSVYSDMGGAHAAGLHGVLIDRDGKHSAYSGAKIVSLMDLQLDLDRQQAPHQK
ncbi:HAD family hydrolase [Streptomyces ferrugineus]|uniref:HAD family hydrolase n=1 Tax=Streptomyces ferrugineus TaxID=1413221 RepID=UPI001D13C11D|nr:HAD-IA family hydrolase [Streptomyces ferrugineus]